MSFTADYTGANGLPTAFRVGDDVCTSTVVGPARTPVAPTSRPSNVGTGSGTAPAAPTAKKAVKAGKDGKPAKPANQKADKPPKKAKPASKDKGKG